MQPHRQSVMGRTGAPREATAPAVRRHRPDYLILLFMALLMLIGLITMYAIGPQRANVLNNAYGANYGDTYFFMKQALSLAMAGVAFTTFALVPYSFIAKHASKVFILGIAACTLLFIAGNLLDIRALVPETLGAHRWFSLGPLGSFQPAELLKFGVLLFLAGFIGMRYKQGDINNVERTLVPVGIVMFIAIIFVIGFQKDMGTGISLSAILFAMLFVSHLKFELLGKIALAALLVGVAFIFIAPHRMERVATFFSGDVLSGAEASSEAYHIKQASIAIGTGGLFGLGIGNSVQATGYLPEAINDSVFAILGETFGFVGLVAIMGLFTALLFRLLRTLDGLQDMSMRLLAAGVFGWLAAHVILNIAAMTGLVPLTGITLPLLSYGGTSMMFIAAALGIVYQLSRFTSHSVNNKEIADENSRRWRGVGRTRHASRRRIS